VVLLFSGETLAAREKVVYAEATQLLVRILYILFNYTKYRTKGKGIPRLVFLDLRITCIALDLFLLDAVKEMSS